MNNAYGNWFLVIFNIALFGYFLAQIFKPRSRVDWQTYGTFGAFLVALFAEMYGFPLTIYLLTSYFGSRFSNLDLTHNNGHILNTLLGIKGDPHFGWLHIVSTIFIAGGFIVISKAWNVLYLSQKRGKLAVSGIYSRIRHPQYLGFILIIIGFLLQWPTIITLFMAPFLIWRYARLAKTEEQEMLNKFKTKYISYREKTYDESLIWGAGSGVGLLLFYVLVMLVLSGSWGAVVSQFQELWWLMLPLAIGFGVQGGLFVKLKQKGATLAAGGTSAGVSMIACCLHHTADLLPLVGFSLLAVTLAKYQVPFLIISLFINLFGIRVMLDQLKKQKI